MKWIKILAMSYNLSKIKNMLSNNKNYRFAEHCGKIIIVKDNYKVDHWIDELWGLCSWIMSTTIKPDSKGISKELIIEYFFGCCDTLESFVPILNNTYEQYISKKKRNTKNDNIIFTNYRKFCEHVAIELEKRTLTINKLKNLANKYLI